MKEIFVVAFVILKSNYFEQELPMLKRIIFGLQALKLYKGLLYLQQLN